MTVYRCPSALKGRTEIGNANKRKRKNALLVLKKWAEDMLPCNDHHFSEIPGAKQARRHGEMLIAHLRDSVECNEYTFSDLLFEAVGEHIIRPAERHPNPFIEKEAKYLLAFMEKDARELFRLCLISPLVTNLELSRRGPVSIYIGS